MDTMIRTVIAHIISSICFIVSGCLFAAHTSMAATLNVDTLKMVEPTDNTCSLIEAISLANGDSTQNDCSNETITGNEDIVISFSAALFQDNKRLIVPLPKSVLPINIKRTVTLYVDAQGSTGVRTRQLVLTPESDTTGVIFRTQGGASGGISIDGSLTLTLDGLEFDGSKAPQLGLVELGNASTLELKRLNVHNFGDTRNEKSSQWKGSTTGLIYTQGDRVAKLIDIKDSRFKNNFSLKGGSVIHAKTKKITIVSSQFENNQTIGDGGVANLTLSEPRVESDIRHSFFNHNRAIWDSTKKSAKGGALYVNGVKTRLKLNATRLVNNTSESSGGALAYLDNQGSLILQNNSFLYNKAYDHGGGTYSNAKVRIFNNTFIKNKADVYHGQNDTEGKAVGGAFYVDKSQPVELHNSLFVLNQQVLDRQTSDKQTCFANVSVMKYTWLDFNDGNCQLPASQPGSVIDDQRDLKLHEIKHNNRVVAYSPSPDSPFVNKADNTGCRDAGNNVLGEDINQLPRNLDGDPCDVGSVEMNIFDVSIKSQESSYRLEEKINGAFGKHWKTKVTLKLKNNSKQTLVGADIVFSLPDNLFYLQDNGSLKGGANIRVHRDLRLNQNSTQNIVINIVATKALPLTKIAFVAVNAVDSTFLRQKKPADVVVGFTAGTPPKDQKKSESPSFFESLGSSHPVFIVLLLTAAMTSKCKCRQPPYSSHRG